MHCNHLHGYKSHQNRRPPTLQGSWEGQMRQSLCHNTHYCFLMNNHSPGNGHLMTNYHYSSLKRNWCWSVLLMSRPNLVHSCMTGKETAMMAVVEWLKGKVERSFLYLIISYYCQKVVAQMNNQHQFSCYVDPAVYHYSSVLYVTGLLPILLRILYPFYVVYNLHSNKSVTPYFFGPTLATVIKLNNP